MCELIVFPKSSDWCFKARKDSQWFKTAAQIADSQTEQYSSPQRSDFAAWTNPFTFNFKPSRVQSLTSFRFHSMNKSKTVLLGALIWLSYFWSLCKQLFSELNFTVSTVDRQFELSKYGSSHDVWRALSWSNGPSDPPTVLLAIHRARSRTEANCRCDVRFEWLLITSSRDARTCLVIRIARKKTLIEKV